MTTIVDFERFRDEGYNRIPLMREVLADLDTPVSIYLKLAQGRYSYLLESVQGGEKWGRYSIIGLPCRTIVRVTGQQLVIEQDGKQIHSELTADPLGEIQRIQQQFKVPPIKGLPRFSGGLVGYFGYETVRYIEERLGLADKPDPVLSADIMLMVSDEVIVFDNLIGRLYVIVHVDPKEKDGWREGHARLDRLVRQLDGPIPLPAVTQPRAVSEEDFVSSFERPAFEAAVERCREYIASGDVFQVVLSQRLAIPFDIEPFSLYRALRTVNPSPYMYYLDLDGFQIVGAAIETVVQVQDGIAATHPIAGTRPRGKTPEEDNALESELKNSEKQRAEHIMLVDLGRNDIGRVSVTGTVNVTQLMDVERFSHVMHLVSHVEGKLKPELSVYDALRSCFPAGTVSGAPKIRAMEIIAEVEGERRGPYGGAVGYFSFSGNMDTALILRTGIYKDGVMHIQAGGGIVADSAPEDEYLETQHKAGALQRAIDLAEGRD